jgi:transcriptional regulator with XRE-family HTH domain
MESSSYIERLRQLREEKKLSLKEVAKTLDIPERLLLMIELGELIPTETQMESIIEYVIDQVH